MKNMFPSDFGRACARLPGIETEDQPSPNASGLSILRVPEQTLQSDLWKIGNLEHFSVLKS